MPKNCRPLKPGATIFVPIQVEQIRKGKHTVYVMGEVAKPGAFELQEGATFVDILANSGGPTRYADTRQIRILRGDGKVSMFDMVSFTEGKGGKVPLVSAGDAILVPEKIEIHRTLLAENPLQPRRSGLGRGLQTRPLRMVRRDEPF